MAEGCDIFIGIWMEEIEKVLTNRVNNQIPEEQLCFNITKACVDVDPSNVKPFDDTIMVDGQPVNMVIWSCLYLGSCYWARGSVMQYIGY
jgi:hypothetical protein